MSPGILYAQQIFSKTEFGYKGIFQPYDLPATLPVGGKDFVMLRQFNNNTMELCRYDQYFFSVWEKKITFDAELSVPQIFTKGDSIILFATAIEGDSCKMEFRYHETHKGEFVSRNYFTIPHFRIGELIPDVLLSQNHSKIMMYNYSSSLDSAILSFTVIDLDENQSMQKIYLRKQGFNPTSSTAYITDKGDIFFVCADNEEQKLQLFFRSSRTGEWTNISVDNLFDDSEISEISTQPIGPTSWMVTYSTTSDGRLMGLGTIGVNVILKSVIYNESISFTEQEVNDLYSEKIIIGPKTIKSNENPYADMDNFHLIQTRKTMENSVIVIFERQEVATQFHKGISLQTLPWDYSINEDNVLTSGDILIYCFSDLGEVLWKKAIVKRQEDFGTTLGLSYISAVFGSNLSFLGHIGKDFFATTIKTTDGALIRSLDTLSGKGYLFTKRYSCWLDGYSVVLCGISPLNDGIRKLMLVEF